MSVLTGAMETLARVQPLQVMGRVGGLRGLTVLVDDLPLPVGSLVRVESANGAGADARWSARLAASEPADPPWHASTLGEVVGFTREHAVVMLLGSTVGIRVGDRVIGEAAGGAQSVDVGPALLGRVIDGLGRPIDGDGRVEETLPRALNPRPIAPMRRRRIAQAIHTGVRALDLFVTLGRGQRVGIFSGPGVGKSTLLGAIARGTDADVSVIALIGERGREVRDFIENALGGEGRKRSVVVAATGDESPLMRIRAALVACAVAEWFRDEGRDVMLMMDSVTRFAHAQRQVGLSVGEPPATKGYTPSVFAALPLLLERAGAVEPGGQETAPRTSDGALAPSTCVGGSITGLYTILVEGDDLSEPISDAARGILDGHVILSRRLAQRAHYPAVDVLDSVSRVSDDVCDQIHVQARRQITRLMAVYRDVEDLVQIGAYARGSNPEADVAIDFAPRISELLRQGRDEAQPFDQARAHLVKLALEAGDQLARRARKTG